MWWSFGETRSIKNVFGTCIVDKKTRFYFEIYIYIYYIEKLCLGYIRFIKERQRFFIGCVDFLYIAGKQKVCQKYIGTI